MTRTTATLKSYPNMPSELIRKYHKTNFKLAELAIENRLMNERILSCISIPTNKKLLTKVNKKIECFKEEITRILESENPDSVYTLAIQLFPISK